MKIIDKKGKIFGFINIIDLVVILILGIVIVGGVSRFRKAAPQIVEQNQKALIELEVSEIRQPSVDGLQVGDELFHYDKGQYFGKIVDIKIENFKEAVSTSDGKIVLADVPGKYNALVYVEANAVDTTNAIVVGGEQLRIGAQYRLKNKKVAVFGTIFKVDIVKE